MVAMKRKQRRTGHTRLLFAGRQDAVRAPTPHGSNSPYLWGRRILRISEYTLIIFFLCIETKFISKLLQLRTETFFSLWQYLLLFFLHVLAHARLQFMKEVYHPIFL